MALSCWLVRPVRKNLLRIPLVAVFLQLQTTHCQVRAQGIGPFSVWNRTVNIVMICTCSLYFPFGLGERLSSRCLSAVHGSDAAKRQAITELLFFSSVGDLSRCKNLCDSFGIDVSDARCCDYDKRTPLHLGERLCAPTPDFGPKMRRLINILQFHSSRHPPRPFLFRSGGRGCFLSGHVALAERSQCQRHRPLQEDAPRRRRFGRSWAGEPERMRETRPRLERRSSRGS